MMFETCRRQEELN